MTQTSDVRNIRVHVRPKPRSAKGVSKGAMWTIPQGLPFAGRTFASKRKALKFLREESTRDIKLREYLRTYEGFAELKGARDVSLEGSKVVREGKKSSPVVKARRAKVWSNK